MKNKPKYLMEALSEKGTEAISSGTYVLSSG